MEMDRHMSQHGTQPIRAPIPDMGIAIPGHHVKRTDPVMAFPESDELGVFR